MKNIIHRIYTSMLDTTKASFLYWQMLCIGMIVFGMYYNFDLPSSIGDELMSYLDIDREQYQNFFTAYSVAALVSVLFGGYMLDKINPQIGTVVFVNILCLGQFLWAIGGQYKSYWTMFVGRLILGIGGCNIQVCRDAISTIYFKGKFLAFSFGTNASLARGASALNFFLTPLICNAVGVRVTGWISFGLCLISGVFVCIFIVLDIQYKKQHQLEQHAVVNKIKFKELVTLRPELWLLCAIAGTYYASFTPFVSVARSMLIDLWGMDPYIASICTGVVYDIPLVFAFIFGKIVDKVGRRLYFLILACCLILSGHILFVTCQPREGNAMKAVPWIAMSLLGISYIFQITSLWTGIGLVVKKNQAGTALALATLSFQLCNFILNNVVGNFSFSTDLYIFMSASVLCVVLVIVLLFVDKKNYNALTQVTSVGIFNDVAEGCYEKIADQQLPEADLTDK